MKDKDVDDIWAGGSLKKSDHPQEDYSYYRYMPSYSNDDGGEFILVLKIVGLVALIIGMLYFSVMGPSMWHNKLVVCHGTTACTEYTDWKVIGENSETGVLEVWAGGRLQRLSNGTWHYE